MTDTPGPATRYEAYPAAAGAPRRTAPPRKGPPGRRDSRRPEPRRFTGAPSRPATGRPGAPPAGQPTGRPSPAALLAAAGRERERQPPYWFACRLLLVLSGQRPVHSLLRHARGAGYDQLCGLARHAPLRPRGTDRRTPAVLDARGSRPRDGVIEAFARIRTGDRQRAIAFRLEYGPDQRWRCAAVELDGLSPARA